MLDQQINKIGNSFVSFDAFMANLEHLEGVFETIRSSLSQGQQLGDVKQTSEADKMLEELGCVEVITKSESGRNFSRQIAGQIDKIFSSLLPKVGGAMTLIDVYLYYNRLRGADIITANDIVMALNELGSMNSSVEMHKCDGGLKILQLRSYVLC